MWQWVECQIDCIWDLCGILVAHFWYAWLAPASMIWGRLSGSSSLPHWYYFPDLLSFLCEVCSLEPGDYVLSLLKVWVKLSLCLLTWWYWAHCVQQRKSWLTTVLSNLFWFLSWVYVITHILFHKNFKAIISTQHYCIFVKKQTNKKPLPVPLK